MFNCSSQIHQKLKSLHTVKGDCGNSTCLNTMRGCKSTSDCPPNHECSNGTCVENPQMEDNGDVAQVAFLVVLVLALGILVIIVCWKIRRINQSIVNPEPDRQMAVPTISSSVPIVPIVSTRMCIPRRHFFLPTDCSHVRRQQYDEIEFSDLSETPPPSYEESIRQAQSQGSQVQTNK